MTRRYYIQFGVHLAIGFLVLLLPVCVQAASISIDHSLGFNGYFRLGSWVPLTVMLENRGRNAKGTLEVIVTSGSEFLQTVHQTVHTSEVELPYNSTKLASFTIHLSAFTHDLIIQLRNQEEILVSTAISLRNAYTEKPMVVVVDERITPDFLSVLPASLFPVNTYPRFLPEAWYGYDGVEALIVNAEVLKSLREPQFLALQAWIRQGGMLLTSGGMNSGVFTENRLQQLLPMRILGHQEVMELPDLADFCGQNLTSDVPFLMLRTQIQNGKILLEESGFPFIVEKVFGAGKIVFIALDLQHPPFSRWTGRPAFWERILTLKPEIAQPLLTIDPQILVTTLLNNMPADFPDKRVAFVFLGLYVLLLRLLMVQFGRRGVNNWKTLGIMLVVIVLFTITSYVVFFRPNQQQRLAYDSVLHLHVQGNASFAFGEYLLGVYALKNTTYNFGFGREGYPLRPLIAQNSQQQTPEPYVLQESERGLRIHGTLEKWSYNFFRFSSSFEFPIRAEAQYKAEEGLHLNLENHTPYQLKSVYGYFAGRIFPIGNIPTDSTVTKSLKVAAIQAQEPLDSSQLQNLLQSIPENGSLPFWQRMQRDLTKALFGNIQKTYEQREDLLILTGWMSSALLEADLADPDNIGVSAAYVTWAIPMEEL